MFRRFSLPLALVSALAVPAVAHAADEAGASGFIESLQINDDGGTGYLAFHGRIVVAKKNASAEYRWGGLSCGSRTLSEGQVSLLTQALANGLQITPYHVPGQGTTQCLVGFTLTN